MQHQRQQAQHSTAVCSRRQAAAATSELAEQSRDSRAGMAATCAAGRSLAHQRLATAAAKSARGPACGWRRAPVRAGSAPAAGTGQRAGAQGGCPTVWQLLPQAWQPAIPQPAPLHQQSFCTAGCCCWSLTSSSSCPASLLCRLGCCSCSWRGTRPESAHRRPCCCCNCRGAGAGASCQEEG